MAFRNIECGAYFIYALYLGQMLAYVRGGAVYQRIYKASLTLTVKQGEIIDNLLGYVEYKMRKFLFWKSFIVEIELSEKVENALVSRTFENILWKNIKKW